MLVKRYISEGLAHFSYLVADQGQATVIDPRRDVVVYLDEAAAGGFHIDHVLETHRNEDYLVGSCEIESITGAEIFHADSQWDYQYGFPAEEGQIWWVGRLKIQAIATPGHTPGSMSYLLYDPDGNPWMIFTGDALFSGDVGRVDLMGQNRLEEMAGLLYDSLFTKILPLGDGIIICPAHGSGSVCGAGINDRTWTTIGMERKNNPKLQVDSKEDFIKTHAQMLERPPYFKKMEQLNVEGPPILGKLPWLRPMLPNAFSEAGQEALVLDTRDQISFGSAHLAGSLALWSDTLPKFAGWFLPYHQPIVMINDQLSHERILRMLIRMGFDNLSGYLKGGVLNWSWAGKQLEKVEIISVSAFYQTVNNDPDIFVLDVRSADQPWDDGIPQGVHIPLTQLKDNLSEVPKDKRVYIICTRGNRSMTAASLLMNQGYQDIVVLIGGLTAWQAYLRNEV